MKLYLLTFFIFWCLILGGCNGSFDVQQESVFSKCWAADNYSGSENKQGGSFAGILIVEVDGSLLRAEMYSPICTDSSQITGIVDEVGKIHHALGLDDSVDKKIDGIGSNLIDLEQPLDTYVIFGTGRIPAGGNKGPMNIILDEVVSLTKIDSSMMTKASLDQADRHYTSLIKSNIRK